MRLINRRRQKKLEKEKKEAEEAAQKEVEIDIPEIIKPIHKISSSKRLDMVQKQLEKEKKHAHAYKRQFTIKQRNVMKHLNHRRISKADHKR